MLIPPAAMLAAFACAQTYPAKTVRMIVPFSPGGAVDVPTRLIAQKLAEAWGHQVVVDNRPGAGSTIGADLAAKAPPDGYTLLMAGPPHVISAGLYRKLPYDPVTDFAAVMGIGYSPNALVVHPALPAKNVKDLVALARARPDQIDYASSGNGSTQHLCAALFTSMTGIRMNHIPYKGSAPALTDLLSGQVQVSIPSVNNVLQHVRAQRLRALGVTSAQRSRELPEVPTLSEAGAKGYEAVTWIALLAQAAVPKEVIAKLNADVGRVLQVPDVQKGILATGTEIHPTPPERAAAELREERTKWAKVVKETGMQVN